MAETDNKDLIDVTEKQDGGVLKEIIKTGTGESKPRKGNNVHVHYVGTLLDGTKFDSSRDRDQQFQFKLGTGEVIKAWDMGVATMCRGELARLTCKPEYAYGAAGSPPKIPPDSTLVFEVELFDWEGEDISPDSDKSMIREIVVEGTKWTQPNEGAKLQATIKASHDDRVFFDRDVSFVLGECCLEKLPEGVDKALLRMNKGEHSIIEMGPKWGYGDEGCAEFNIPANARLKFDIKLTEFEKAKQSWEMDLEEKLTESEKHKARGTEFFQQHNFKLAISKYTKIDDLLQHEKTAEGENKTHRDQLLLAAHLNLALCYLKQGATIECIKHCNSALDVSASNVKALYRRAQALEKQKDYEQALEDYESVVELEPNNKAAASQIVFCRRKVSEFEAKEKHRYKSLFSKYIEEEAEVREAEEAKQKARDAGKTKQFPKGSVVGDENGVGEGDQSTKENGSESIDTTDMDNTPVVDAVVDAAAPNSE